MHIFQTHFFNCSTLNLKISHLHWIAKILHAKSHDTGRINRVICFPAKPTILATIHALQTDDDVTDDRKIIDHRRHIVPKTQPNGRQYKKFELMLRRRARGYSSCCSQIVSLSPAISSRLLREYRYLMSSWAGFREPRKSRLGPSKSTFNSKNFICSFLRSILISFGAIRSWNVSRSPKSPKNPLKPLF